MDGINQGRVGILDFLEVVRFQLAKLNSKDISRLGSQGCHRLEFAVDAFGTSCIGIGLLQLHA